MALGAQGFDVILTLETLFLKRRIEWSVSVGWGTDLTSMIGHLVDTKTAQEDHGRYRP